MWALGQPVADVGRSPRGIKPVGPEALLAILADLPAMRLRQAGNLD
jgi:hypothetical protein